MSNEVRKVSSTGGEKGSKDERFDLLPPEALEQIARHFGVGAKKYDDHNWRRGYDWSLSYASLQRHANAFWSGEDIDEETGSPHMAAVAFHAMALLVFMQDHRDFDDRYKPSVPAPEHPLGEVFETELPQVDGYYEDGEGDIWQLRTGRPWGDGRWSIVFDSDFGYIDPADRALSWAENDLDSFYPFTRVGDPTP